MTREEHLIYCKKCDNKTFDLKKGIICNLTGEIADFDSDCPHFTGDRESLIFPKLEIDVSKLKRTKIKDKENTFKNVLKYLVKGKLGVTIIIMAFSYLYMVGMMIMGYNLFNANINDIVSFGANVRSYTIGGEYWRLFTTLFLHVNVWHLITDLVIFLGVGYMLEPVIKKSRFIYTILLAGIIAGLINITLFFEGYNTGMSTSIMGLLGLYIIQFVTRPELRKADRKLLFSVVIFFLTLLFFGFTEGFLNIILITALFVGLLTGTTFNLIDKKREYKYLTFLGHLSVIAVILMSSYVYTASSPKQPDKYMKLMNEFSQAEQNALSVYRYSPGTPYKTLLGAVNTHGLPNWKLCLEKLKEIDKLDELNLYCIKKNELTKQYCKMRIKAFEYLRDAYKSESNAFDKEMILENTKIQLQINKIKLLDEIANSEFYASQGMISPLLYMVNNNIVSNLSRVDIDKVVDVKWIMDSYSIKKVTAKDVKGIIKITIDASKMQ